MRTIDRLSVVALFTCMLCGCSTTDYDSENCSLAAYRPPEREIWADSWLYAEAPQLFAEDWIPNKPEMEGKYVLVMFWHTFSPPSQKMIPQLNEWHKKYKDKLVIISISDESHETVSKAREDLGVRYFDAVDTQNRTHSELNIFGLPHIIIIEPDYGCVIWEGYPLLRGYELTEETIERILAVGRKRKTVER